MPKKTHYCVVKEYLKEVSIKKGEQKMHVALKALAKPGLLCPSTEQKTTDTLRIIKGGALACRSKKSGSFGPPL